MRAGAFVLGTLLASLFAPGAWAQPLAEPELLARLHFVAEGNREAQALAATRGSTEELRSLARALQRTEERIDARVMDRSAGPGLLPSSVSYARIVQQPIRQAQDRALDRLRSLEGLAFDREFLVHVVSNYEQASRAVEDARAATADAGLRAFLDGLVPLLDGQRDSAASVLERLQQAEDAAQNVR